MPPREPKLKPECLEERLAALPGLARVREAAVGIDAYLVGGAVRDLLLGRRRTDLDVAVEGGVDELAARLGEPLRSHQRFATATVGSDGVAVDLAATRSETYPAPGALPEVSPAPLLSDLARRDFTINAMAVPLAGEARLIDPHGGRGDLELGRLRALHPGSFVDDPTRALRAARYAARYGFALDPDTERLARGADLDTVSDDRLEAELRKLAAEPDPGRGFELLEAWGLLDLAPGAVQLAGRVAELARAKPWGSVAAPGEAVLAAAFGRGAEAARALAAAEPARPSQGVALARGRGGAELVVARALGARWLDDYVARWRDVRLAIDGNDLIAAGVERGPAVGRGLAAALEAKLDGKAEGPNEELRVALEAAREDARS